MTDNEIIKLINESSENGQRALFDEYYNYVYAVSIIILRGVYTNDNLTKQYYEKRFCTLDDNINVGDLINMDELYTFVDYKGKLYCLGPSGGRGYLGKSFYPYHGRIPPLLSEAKVGDECLISY